MTRKAEDNMTEHDDKQAPAPDETLEDVDLAYEDDCLPEIVARFTADGPDLGDAEAVPFEVSDTEGYADPAESVGPLHLTARQRVEARNIVLAAARAMLPHEPAIHYTQGGKRWDGINGELRVVRGEFPHYADCSSMTTWMLWNALTHALRDLTIPDVVNGANWRAGYTGTQRNHGRRVAPPYLVGDLAHYGGGTGAHVAIYVGGGYVFSHGSERGPYKLPIRYRSDLNQVRRYIRAR